MYPRNTDHTVRVPIAPWRPARQLLAIATGELSRENRGVILLEKAPSAMVLPPSTPSRDFDAELGLPYAILGAVDLPEVGVIASIERALREVGGRFLAGFHGYDYNPASATKTREYRPTGKSHSFRVDAEKFRDLVLPDRDYEEAIDLILPYINFHDMTLTVTLVEYVKG